MKIRLKVDHLLAEFQDLPDGKTYIYTLHSYDEKCLYVGQTTNLQRRICEHLADGKSFSRVEADVCGSDIANQCEADTIVKLRPTLNRMLPSTEKYRTMSSFKLDLFKIISNVECFNDRIAIQLAPNMHGVYSEYISSENADKLLKLMPGFVSGAYLIALGEDDE